MLITDQSRALHERACESLVNGVSSGMRRKVTDPPLYFERGEGPYFFDVDGQRLLDYTLGWGPLILGSNHAALNEAIRRQLNLSYSFGAQHHGEIELAELMVASIPGVEQVIFSNTGSEAVQAALRIARATTGRDLIVKFEGHYHGWFNNVLVSYHPSAQQLGSPAPTCGGQPADEYRGTLVLPWNDLPALRACFAAHPDRIACVLTEPLLANSGSCMPEPGFLQGVIDLCREHGAMSIFDEVITGFRVALGGARAMFDVAPDLTTYAKAMAGGFTMAAVAGRREVFDVLRDGRTIHAGTYNGNSISVAAAIATIQALSEPGVYDRMLGHGGAIRETLEAAAREAGHPLVTTGVGSIFSVHFGLTSPPRSYADVLRADAGKYDRFRRLMLERGVQLLPEGRWYVGASHGEAELALAAPAIREAMAAL